jgi:hypothetical protein
VKKFSLLCCLTALCCAVPAHATLESIPPAIGLLPYPPASVLPGKLTSNTYIFMFLEKQNVTLTSPLSVDITAPGVTYTKRGQITSGLTIPAGTMVNSYYLHTNPASGSLTFTGEAIGFSTDEIVIGVMISSPTLASGVPVVGESQTTYNGAGAQNGLHLAPLGEDSIEISTDQHTVTLTEVLKSTSITEIRLITQIVPMIIPNTAAATSPNK